MGGIPANSALSPPNSALSTPNSALSVSAGSAQKCSFGFGRPVFRVLVL